MPYEDILCSWLVRSALVSLTILLIGSGAVLIWRQPLRRVRIIELVLAGCLIAPWLGMIPGYPQFSVVRSQATTIKQQEAASLAPVELMTEPAISEPTMMPLPVSDHSTPPVPAKKSVEASAHAFEIRPWIVGVYLAGVVIGAGWWLVGIAGLVRLFWSSQPAPLRYRELLTEISRGRSDRVRLLVNRRLSQPFASSWGRAVIVLPESLCGDEQTLRWCLAHEWAHVDGHDFRAWLLAGLAKVLFFYQPLLWWLRRQLRLCQDFLADSQAALQAAEVEDYAEFLTARAAGRLHPAVVGLSMGCRKSEIYRRVIMLLKNESLESRIPRLWTVSVTVAALVLVGVVAAVSLVPRAVAEEKPAISQSKEAGGRTKELPKELTVDLGKGIKLEMVLIPAGEFMMGSPEPDEEVPSVSWMSQHPVRITKPFYLGKYKVTEEEWQAVMGDNSGHSNEPKHELSFDDCQEFLKKLNANYAGGRGKFTLPTEAQWEYACRAGSKTRYFFSNDNPLTVDKSQLDEYAFDWKPGGKAHAVKPNAWGLYDMYGNVFEWCADWWARDVDNNNYSLVNDPSGPHTGRYRVAHGGHDGSAFRFGIKPSAHNTVLLGLRVSLIPAEPLATIRLSSANDQSGKTSTAKPADEVSPASDHSATKEGAKDMDEPRSYGPGANNTGRIAAPITYKDTMLIAATSEGVAAIVFGETVEHGTKYRFRFLKKGSSQELVGNGIVFERYVNGNYDGGKLTIRAGTIRLGWSDGGDDHHGCWIYYEPESMRLQIASADRFADYDDTRSINAIHHVEKLNLKRFLNER